MAPFDQPVNTYSDTTPHKRVITDIVSLIDPSDAPIINYLGGLDGAAGKFRFVNEKGKVCEWLEDSLIPISSTFNAADTLASTATAWAVADGSILQVGHILLAESEHIWVSAVSGDSVTVTRAFGGTTAASHASLLAYSVIGMARLEGAESTSIGLTDRTTNSNFTQILHKEIKVTRTHQQLAQYGISDEMAYQQDKAVPELMRLLERHFFYNGAAASGSSTTPRAMGGIKAFITDNTITGQTLAQADFENATMAAFSDGGVGPWVAPVSPTNFQRIKNFYDSSNYLRIERTENTVGMVVNEILTPFGLVHLLLDRWATNSEVVLIDPNHAGFKTYYPFTWEPLAKTGDYDRAEVVGEFTLCVRQDKAHALITAITA